MYKFVHTTTYNKPRYYLLSLFLSLSLSFSNYLNVLMIFVLGWVNRFANAGDTAMEVAGNTALKVSYFQFYCFLFL